jgi:hypothetical protein
VDRSCLSKDSHLELKAEKAQKISYVVRSEFLSRFQISLYGVLPEL